MALRPGLIGTVLVGASVAFAADSAPAEQAPACVAWQSEYAIAGTLRLANTPFGKADGTHKVGPGKVVLRFEPGGRVSIVSYEMRQPLKFAVTAFFNTVHIGANTTTTATPDACAVVATGAVKGNTVQWASPVHGVLTVGTLSCEGKYCGKYGVPPPGEHPVRLGPSDMRVRPFEFSKGWTTFTMPYTLGAKMESPKHTSFLALTGREVKRTCVAPPPPCKR